MYKTFSIIVSSALFVSIVILFLGQSNRNSNLMAEPEQNIEIKDGIQYVTINARGGYFPRVSKAKADIPTKLIIKTNGTYDCSAALVINSINYKKILSPNGEEVIDLSLPQAGTVQGFCSMGMYNFEINFE